jgi:hypothetical protein
VRRFVAAELFQSRGRPRRPLRRRGSVGGVCRLASVRRRVVVGERALAIEGGTAGRWSEVRNRDDDFAAKARIRPTCPERALERIRVAGRSIARHR